jgi:PKD repeat protein
MYTSRFLLKDSVARRGFGNNSFHSISLIVSVILMLTAISCGTGGTNNTGAPIANPGGPYLGNANQSLAFNGSASSAPSGKTLTSYAWLFGDGASGTGATTSHTYTVAGNYTATLTVTDSSGATNSSNVAVQIITAPVAKPGGPYTGKVGVAVSFNGSASTAPPGQALGFSWNFGDGATGSGATPTHIYSAVCTCTVTLTVTDDTAGTSFATTTATISAGPAPSGQSQTFFAIGPAASASSQFAYVLDSSGTGINSLSIEMIDTTTGELRPVGVTPPLLDNKFVPAGMITDPSQTFLYVYGGNSVLTFSIAPDTGALTPSGATSANGSANAAGNEALIFTPSGKFAFFITQDANAGDSTTTGSITRFSVDPNSGTLGKVETLSAQVSRPQSSAIDPSGKFLYVSGFEPVAAADKTSAASQIAILSVAPGTGALSPVPNSPLSIQSGIVATSIAIDSTGHFIFAAGRNSATSSAALSVFAINSNTGVLTQSFSPLVLGDAVADATSLALSPSANFGFVLTVPDRSTAAEAQSAHLFQWDAHTGTLVLGDSSVRYDNLPSQLTTSVAKVVLFSPSQTDGPNLSIPTPAIFLFIPVSSGVPLFGEKLDPKTGSFTWMAGQSNSVGH